MKTFRLGLFSACAAALLPVPLAAANIVLAAYPNKMQFIDDASGKVVDVVDLQTGLPVHMQHSVDGTKIFVRTIPRSGIEVLDAHTHKILTHVSLDTPSTRYRISVGAPDAEGRYYYLIAKGIDKGVDTFRIGKTQVIVVDVQTGKIVRSADLDVDAEDVNEYRHSLAVSPDGRTLFAFLKNVLVIDTASMKVVDRIELAKPVTPGTQEVDMDSGLETLRNLGEYVSVFNAEDPYIHNKVFGIARFDLAARKFSFKPIGPAPESMAGLEVTPDGKDGYTVAVRGNLGDQRCEFWHFNLATSVAVNSAEFSCRRRFSFGMSHDGKKLYIYGAGFDIAVYDAKTLKYLTDWEVKYDVTPAGMLTVQ